MVNGIESFRKKFKDFSGCYTVIGGTACDILLSEADLPFRSTNDIDIVLILEDKFPEFATVFWDYIKNAEYKCGWKNNDDVHFYRFTEPKDGYPIRIELFSRKPEYVLNAPKGIVPVKIDDDTSSLSAILLNDDFYNFMIEGRNIINGIPVLKPEYLIPFKMYAWLNLVKEKSEGRITKEKDLKKHKYDVFRLLQIVVEGTKVATNGIVQTTVSEFISKMEKLPDKEIQLLQIGLPFDRIRAVALLKEIYI